MEVRFGDISIECTNVERVMFPDGGITKGELIAYYRDVADLMVPGLRRRPLTIERFRARFQWMEEAAGEDGRELRSLTLEELERLWTEAKARERG